MLRKTLSGLYLALAVCATAIGQVTLEQKFPEDSSFSVETSSKLQQKLSIAGTEVDTGSDTRMTLKANVGKRDVEGKLRVEQKIQSLQATLDVMGQSYSFDSANPDDKGGSPLEIMREMHKALVKRTTTIVYDKDNRAVAAESDQDVSTALPAEIKALVGSQLDTENLKSEANESLDQLTREPVNKGDTWERMKVTNFGAGQVMDFKTQYTYEGTIEKDGKTLDKITTKVLAISFALENSPLPLALKSSDLKPAETDGVILYDRGRKMIVEANSNVRVTGEITFTVNNQDLPAKLDLKMQTEIATKP